MISSFSTLLGFGSINKIEVWPVKTQESKIHVFTEGNEETCTITLNDKPISAGLIRGHTAELNAIACDEKFGQNVENKIDEMIGRLSLNVLNDVAVLKADETHSVVIVIAKDASMPSCHARVTSVLPERFFIENAHLLENIPCEDESAFGNKIDEEVKNMERRIFGNVADLPPPRTVQNTYLVMLEAFFRGVPSGTPQEGKCRAGFTLDRLTFTLFDAGSGRCDRESVQRMGNVFWQKMRRYSLERSSWYNDQSDRVLVKVHNGTDDLSIGCYVNGTLFAEISHKYLRLMDSTDFFDSARNDEKFRKQSTTAACNILARLYQETPKQ